MSESCNTATHKTLILLLCVMTIPIVFAFDKRFELPACVCLTSLLENANNDTFYDVFILHSGPELLDSIEIGKIADIYNNCKINFLSVGETFKDAFVIRGISTTTYYRLLIPELIPQYDRILYSDVDVIFREDLSDLYNTDLEDNYIGGVTTLFHLFPEYASYYTKLGLNPIDTVYAGNLLINSKAIREYGLTNRFIEMVKNNYVYQDMDILNIACAGRIKKMPPSLCLTTFSSEYITNHKDMIKDMWTETEMNDALMHGIIHYNGQKPWIDTCPNFDVWWEYYRKSPIFDAKFYYNFWDQRIEPLDKLTLWKRIKVLIRYFTVGKK